MVTLGMAEILEKVEAEKDKDKKVEILRSNDSKPLRDLLRMAYDKNLKWLVPEGLPPLKDSGAIDQEGNLYAEWRRMYLFIEGWPSPGGAPQTDMPSLKRETLFIQMLESLDKKDAALLCSVKDKKMPYKSLRKDLIEKAFPGLMVGLDG